MVMIFITKDKFSCNHSSQKHHIRQQKIINLLNAFIQIYDQFNLLKYFVKLVFVDNFLRNIYNAVYPFVIINFSIKLNTPGLYMSHLQFKDVLFYLTCGCTWRVVYRNLRGLSDFVFALVKGMESHLACAAKQPKPFVGYIKRYSSVITLL